MVIKFYGTRGSIAVANKETEKYGGNTTCLYIESNKGDALVIDAGTGIRRLGIHLLENNKDKIHLLFTHYHWDHIQGFPFFAPIFFKNEVITIYGSNKEVTAKKALSYQMTKPYFPAALDGLPANITFKDLKNGKKISGLVVETIVTNHPDYTLGLKFKEGKKSFVFLTDNELLAENGNTEYKEFVAFIKGSDFLIHDAQYTDEIYEKRIGWGHSTHKQVMKLATDAHVKGVIFTHHDHGSSDEFIDTVLKDVRSEYPRLDIQAAADGKKITLK
jgi:phosphoribosyl 1,2-cyclic phosphodiesterase